MTTDSGSEISESFVVKNWLFLGVVLVVLVVVIGDDLSRLDWRVGVGVGFGAGRARFWGVEVEGCCVCCCGWRAGRPLGRGMVRLLYSNVTDFGLCFFHSRFLCKLPLVEFLNA